MDLGQDLLGRELLVCHIYSVFWDVSTYTRVDGFELAQQIKDRFAAAEMQAAIWPARSSCTLLYDNSGTTGAAQAL